jgi:acyl carrier protein
MEISEFMSCFNEQFIGQNSMIAETEEFRKIDSWDSLTEMALLCAIEEKYGVAIPIDNFARLTTPKEIFAYIESQVAQ